MIGRETICQLTSTIARRRMTAIASTALVFGLASIGFDVLLPLWVTRELHYSAADFAQLRSLRFAGTLLGVIILGALSDRFGQRLIGALSMLAAGVFFLMFGLGVTAALPLCVPFLGSVVSTAFVNLNTLTQQISDRRQGLANSIYRTIYAVTGIIAPVVVTGLAIVFGGYSGVLILLACLLAVSAATLFAYPGESVPSSLGSIRLEAERMWHGYRTITKKRPLMKFFHLSLGWGALLTSVGTFAAIRFTRELGLSDQQFGTLSAVAGTLTLTVTMLFALILDRVSLRKIHIPAMLAASSFAILMGLGDSLVLSIIGFLGFGPIAGVMIAPSSMWVGRAAGPDSLTAGFSVHKVLMSFYVALASALFGILEHLIGIRLVLLATGIAGLPLALAFIRLHEPSSHNA